MTLALAPLALAPVLAGADLARLYPAQTVVYAEAPGVGELLGEGLEHPFVASVLESPLGQALLAESAVTPEAGLAFVDAWLGRPLLPSLRALTARGLALGAIGGHEPPRWLIAARSDDAELTRQVIDEVCGRLAFLAGAGGTGPLEGPGGFSIWNVGDEISIASSGELLLLGGDEATLRAAIGRAQGDEDTLAQRGGFERARGRRRDGALAWAWLDLEAIERADPSKLVDLRNAATDPGVHFLLGSLVASFGATADLCFALDVEDDRITLAIDGAEADASRRALVASGSPAIALPPPTAGELGRAVVYRDLDALFELRTEIFPVDVQPGFAEATSNLALFFGGQDVSDEILPRLSPWFGVVAREATFAADAVPDVPLPAAALLARVEDPDTVGPQLVAAFQSVIGVTNVDGAQQMRPPLVMALTLEGDVPITAARFTKPAPGEGVDVHHNLAPACAVVGETFIIGTHESLVRELVRQLSSEGAEATAASGESLTLSGPAIAEVLRTNEEVLVMQTVLDEGKTMEKARADVAGLVALADLFERLDVSAERDADGTLSLRLCASLAAGGGR